MVKNLPAMLETRLPSVGQEDPLQKGIATHFSIPAQRIPWTGSLVGYSPWGHKESDRAEGITLHLQLALALLFNVIWFSSCWLL